MKKALFSSRLLLLALLTVIYRAESSNRHFIVEFEQDGCVLEGSFFIKPDPNALSYNPSCVAYIMDHRVATSIITQGHDPFVITTMMLPGNDQQQGQSQNEQTNSSGQRASGTTTTGISGWITGSSASGSGDGGESPEQPRHTYGLSCHVDSCHGVCKLRSLPYRVANATRSLMSQVSEAIVNLPLILTGFYWTPCAARSNPMKHPESHGQPQHSYGFNCHVDSCHGDCKLRASSDDTDPADTPRTGPMFYKICDVCGTPCINANALREHRIRFHGKW